MGLAINDPPTLRLREQVCRPLPGLVRDMIHFAPVLEPRLRAYFDALAAAKAST